MRFHVTFEVRDTIVLDDDKRMREFLGPHMQRIMESARSKTVASCAASEAAFTSSTSMPPRSCSNCLAPKFTLILKRTCSP